MADSIQEVRARILIVEDNEGDVDLVREVIPPDIELLWAEDAASAWQLLEGVVPDLILLDHDLPDSNGLTWLGQLRERQYDYPVVMLTGREDRALALSVLQMGGQNFLVKSEILEHLASVLEEHLGFAMHGKSEDDSKSRFSDRADDFYPLLLETMSDGCLVVDDRGVMTFINRAGRHLLDPAQGSVLGGHIVDLLDTASKPAMQQALQQARGSTEPIRTSFEARLRGSGDDTPVKVSMHTLHDKRGQLEHCVFIINDLTQQVRARELRRELVRSLVHDLRTPLGSIASALSLVRSPRVDRIVAEEMLDVIDLCTRELLQLVEQILEIEKLESGVLPLACLEIDVDEMIADVMRAQSSLVESKGLRVHSYCETDTPRAYIDAALITRVLQNLLSNAIRHTPSGGLITVRLSTLDANLVVAVTDTGPGIDPSIAEHLFEKFVRSSNGGSGLGLTFCKFAVEAHGGIIWFESVVDAGTTFRFTLPMAPRG